MKYLIKTETGSEWTIDTTKKEWSRPDNPNSKHVRGNDGKFYVIRNMNIGERFAMLCPPYDGAKESDARVIYSSPITSITEMKDELVQR